MKKLIYIILLFVTLCGPSFSAVVKLDLIEGNWLSSDDIRSQSGNLLTGKYQPPAKPLLEYRTYMVFNSPGFTEQITSVRFISGLAESTQNGTLSVYSIETNLNILRDGNRCLFNSCLDIYNDLGDGHLYGSSEIDLISDTQADLLLSDINIINLVANGGMFAIGLQYESNGYILGGFGVVPDPYPFIEVTTVPIPGAIVLLSSALFFLFPALKRIREPTINRANI